MVLGTRAFRAFAAALVSGLVLVATACTMTGTAARAAGRPGEPRTGACFTFTDPRTYAASRTVPCSQRHTAEITAVRHPAGLGLDYANMIDHWDLDAYAARRCPDRNAYLGYRGVLAGTYTVGWVVPTEEAQAKGAHWVACVIEATDRGATMLDARLEQRTGSIRHRVTTDEQLLEAGTVCTHDPLDIEGQVSCGPRFDRYLLVARQDSPDSLGPSQEQAQYASSFCTAVTAVYAKRGPFRVNESVIQPSAGGPAPANSCFMPYRMFRGPGFIYDLRPSQRSFADGVERSYAADLSKIGGKIATDLDLLAAPALRHVGDPGYFTDRTAQAATVCAVLTCTGAEQVSAAAYDARLTFTIAASHEGKSCRGDISFPLAYLGAPFTVEAVTCH